jgi:hypothetical protein
MHHESRFMIHESGSIQLIFQIYCKDFGLETPNRVSSCMDRESVQVNLKKPVWIQEPEAISEKSGLFFDTQGTNAQAHRSELAA